MNNYPRFIAKIVTFFIEQIERIECGSSSVYDVPDPRDYHAPEINPINANLPDEFSLLEKIDPLKWEAIKQSWNTCSSYSKKYQNEICNTIWNEILCEIDGEELWGHQEYSGAVRQNGDTLQNSQKQFHKNPQGFPQYEFFRLRWTGHKLVEQMKLWVYARFQPIQTGGKWRYLNGKNNYSEGKKTGEWFPFLGGKTIGAHAWNVIGWTKTHWIIIESELDQWGDHKIKGVFLVDMVNTERMFSKYVFRDAIDKK